MRSAFTTLAHSLAAPIDRHFLPEWARPYLESLESPEVNADRMTAIWLFQTSRRRHAAFPCDWSSVVHSSDLFATVGFWQNWSPATMPSGLVTDARDAASDLYLLTPSTIPFEADPLRYGGDR